MVIKNKKRKIILVFFRFTFYFIFVSTSNRSTFPPGQHISSSNNASKTEDGGQTASTVRGSKGREKQADSTGSMIYEQN